MNTSTTPDALAITRKDQGPFIQMGTTFSCNSVPWDGVALASPTAIYLLKKSQKAPSAHLYGGGLLGVLIAQAFKKDPDHIRTCTLSLLNPAISAELDPKNKLAEKDVIIILRDTVSHATRSNWSNNISIEAGNDKFKIDTHLFSFKAIPNQMEQHAWVFNQPLAPRLKPMHDTRSQSEVLNAPRIPMHRRVLFIGLAVGLLIAVVVIIMLIALSNP